MRQEEGERRRSFRHEGREGEGTFAKTTTFVTRRRRNVTTTKPKKLSSLSNGRCQREDTVAFLPLRSTVRTKSWPPAACFRNKSVRVSDFTVKVS